MPVILKRDDESLWLDRSVQDADLLEILLLTCDEEQMKAHPVSKIVGNVKNDFYQDLTL